MLTFIIFVFLISALVRGWCNQHDIKQLEARIERIEGHLRVTNYD